MPGGVKKTLADKLFSFVLSSSVVETNNSTSGSVFISIVDGECNCLIVSLTRLDGPMSESRLQLVTFNYYYRSDEVIM